MITRFNSIFILLSTFALFHLSSAQSQAQEGFWFGISPGIQNTLLYSGFRSEIDTRSIARPVLMASASYVYSERFSVQSGIGYAFYTQNTSKFSNDFHYATFPLYFKFRRKQKKKKGWKRNQLTTMIGTNFQYLIAARNNYEGKHNDITAYTARYHVDNLLAIGITRQINSSSVMEAYFTSSFGSVINKHSLDGFSLVNTNFGLLFNFRFQLNGKMKSE